MNLNMRHSARFFILTVFILFASCGSDDELTKQQITFTVPETAIPMGSEVIIFVTNAEGKLLALEQAFRGLTTVIKLPNDAPKKFNLHKLTYTNETEYTEFRIQSFVNAHAGDFSLAPILAPEEQETGLHTLQLSNVPGGYIPRGMGSGVFCCSWSGSPGNLTIKSAVPTAGAEKLVYYMTSLDNKSLVPRYKVYTNAQPGITETLSFNDMILADKKTLELGEEVTGVGVTIRTQPGNSSFEVFSAFNTSTVPLYYPGNVFETYDTYIEMSKGNFRYYYKTIGAIPTVMKKLPVTINSFTADQDELMIDHTGSFDFLLAYSGAEWTTTTTHYLDWLVYLDDHTEKFVIPELPAELITRYPELAGAFVNFDYINVSDRNDLDGYEDWLITNLNPEIPASSSYTEGLSLSANFASGGDRKRNRRERILTDMR